MPRANTPRQLDFEQRNQPVIKQEEGGWLPKHVGKYY